jgi:hypothetical protein
MSRKFESYEDLFIDSETVDNNCKMNNVTVPDSSSSHDGCIEYHSSKETNNFSEENYEQNHIINTETDDFSFEDVEDDSSFADAADESSGSGSNGDEGDSGDSDSSFDDMPEDDMGSDDFGSDDMGMDSGDEGSGDNSGNGDGGGIDVIDNNKGSSLNPYTQINQKRWAIDTLNELSKVIQNALDLYNPRYADWSEVDQLKSLGKIIEDEKRSFIMQQNPENLINVGLYYEACDVIVQKIVDKINAKKNQERS